MELEDLTFVGICICLPLCLHFLLPAIFSGLVSYHSGLVGFRLHGGTKLRRQESWEMAENIPRSRFYCNLLLIQ